MMFKLRWVFVNIKSGKKMGFSLIELLVVITIIGLLISLVYVSFTESRERTRDKVRQTTLLDMQLAIEQFKAQNGKYPEPGCALTGDEIWSTQGHPGGPNLLRRYISSGLFIEDICHQPFIKGLVPDYIGSFPSEEAYYYRTNSDRSAYKLVVFRKVESEVLSDQNDRFSVCSTQCYNQIPTPKTTDAPGTFLCGNGTWQTSYGVASVGAECWGAGE